VLQLSQHGTSSSADVQTQAAIAQALKALRERAHPRYAFLDAGTDEAQAHHVRELVQRIRKDADDLIVLGIGGSSLGTIAVMQACAGDARKHVHFLESPDPTTVKQLLKSLDAKRTAINVISKSGNTIETLALWSVVAPWLKQGDEATFKNRVVITTDPQHSPLLDLARENGFQVLPVPSEIGGRFSVFTSVGLFPLAFANIDLDELKKGIQRANQNLQEVSIAPMLAQILTHAQLNEHRNTLIVWPYSDALSSVGRWFQQLWAESLGKAKHLDGSIAHVGSTPVACIGPNDQHSLLQLFVEGPKDKHFLFIVPQQLTETFCIEKPAPGFDFLQGIDLGQVMMAEARATCAALASQGHPSTFLTLDNLSISSIAELFVSFMAATVIAAKLYDVDPFDQPAVELGKKIALGLLGQPQNTAYAQAIPVSQG